MSEKWTEIRNYPNYLISNYGRIFSKNRNIILKNVLESNGYLRVNLYNKNGMKHYSVHRLVVIYFLKYLFGKNYVNHKDSNPLNNHYKNLEWCTASENVIHSLKFGNKIPIIGEECSWAKLTNKDIKLIRIKYKKGIYGYDKLAKEFNVNRITISHIILKKSWRHIK